MTSASFNTEVYEINNWLIVHLPAEASAAMPSRGLCMTDAVIQGVKQKQALEPDGKGSHWFRIDETLAKKLNIAAGDTVRVELTPTKEWPEPTVPKDIDGELAKNHEFKALWDDVTPMARWDWIRWIISTHNADTRKKRIDVAYDKLRKGTRRPCCFNRSMCCEPHVSKSGVLLGA